MQYYFVKHASEVTITYTHTHIHANTIAKQINALRKFQIETPEDGSLLIFVCLYT